MYVKKGLYLKYTSRLLIKEIRYLVIKFLRGGSYDFNAFLCYIEAIPHTFLFSEMHMDHSGTWPFIVTILPQKLPIVDPPRFYIVINLSTKDALVKVIVFSIL